MDRSFPLLSYHPPHPQPFLFGSILFTPNPHLLSRLKAPPTWNLPATSTLQTTPFVPAPCAACLCLLPFPCRFAPPFASIDLYPGNCQPLGGLLVAGPSASLCPCLVLPEFSSESWHSLVLVFLSGGFSRKVKIPGRLQSPAVACPGPLSPRYVAMPAPCRIPGPPLPPTLVS